MEHNESSAIDMSFSQIKDYLGEWYYDAHFSTIEKPAGYDTAKKFCILREERTGEEVFVWMTDIGTPITEDTMVSTAGIVGDELRGLIEQCYHLDKQIKANETQNTQTAIQKGE